jgi:hypothetical protein
MLARSALPRERFRSLALRRRFLPAAGRVRLLWYCRRVFEFGGAEAAASFSLDVRHLDDRPPFLDLRPLESGKPIRCLLFARENLLPELRNSGSKVWVRQHCLDGGIEFVDHLARRALGHPEADPR